LAAAYARVFLPQETLSWLETLGLLLGFLGVGVTAGLRPAAILQTNGFGVLLVFFAAASFALGAVVTQRAESELPVQSMQAWMMLVGAPVLHGAALVLPGETITGIRWSWPTVVGLGYLSVVAAGVGYLLYFELLERVGAIEINLVAYATPLFAAGGGWLLLGEQLQVQTVAGFGIIVAGFVLIKREALRQELPIY
jgi:drug/metabolite transporter (DMT)-like permease